MALDQDVRSDVLGPLEAADRRRSACWLAGAASVLVLVAATFLAVRLQSPGSTPAVSLADAVSATAATGSARMRLHTTWGHGDVDVSGVVDFEHGRSSLRGTMQGRPVETRQIGPDQWSRTDQGSDGKTWSHMTLVQAPGEGLSAAEPSRMLARLAAEGTERSRRAAGDRTVVTVHAPVSAVSGRTDRDGRLVDVGVEIDRDGRIRKLAFEDSATRSRTTITYDDFGVTDEVSPPPADEVMDAAEVLGSVMRPQVPAGTDPSLKKLTEGMPGCELFDQQLREVHARSSAGNRATLEQLYRDAKASCEAKK
jgi:hypothetical protein